MLLPPYLEFQCPHCVVGSVLLPQQFHGERPVRMGAVVGPVLLAPHPPALDHVAQHHDAATALLPHHSPEVDDSVRQRA